MKRISCGLALGAMLLAGGCSDLGPAAGVLEIQATTTELIEGQTLNLGATIRGQLVSPQSVDWYCDDPTTLQVTDGLVTGLAPGVAWVWAQQGSAKDSVAVTVRFEEIGSGEIALRFRGSTARRLLPGRATLYENAETGNQHFVIGGWSDDSGLLVRVPGAPELGEVLVGHFSVHTEPFYLSGNEGVYMRFEESRGDQYWVAVNDSPLQITALDVPELPGLGGTLEGRVFFETAGLLVSYSAGGVETIEQLSDTTVRVFAEFSVPLEYKLSGNATLELQGGPHEAVIPGGSGFATAVDDGLAVHVVTYHPDLMRGAVEADVWVPGIVIGNSDVGEAPPDMLAEPAYGAASWATLHVFQDVDDGVNAHALSTSGVLAIAEYQAPQGEAYGRVRGALAIDMQYFDPVTGTFSGEVTRVISEFTLAVMP